MSYYQQKVWYCIYFNNKELPHITCAVEIHSQYVSDRSVSANSEPVCRCTCYRRLYSDKGPKNHYSSISKQRAI